jgi:flagellar hook-associated protein 3 FlgL
MSRVSENSSTHALNYSIGKARTKLEDLQLKGATLKNITKPSDNPISNVEAMTIGSIQMDSKQFLRNVGYSMLQLNASERSLEQISEIINKAKEIAIAQSSDIYSGDVRKNVSNEVIQLRNQMLAIANTRIGNRYLFSGSATLTRPFDESGQFYGNNEKINLEVSKDFFVPINISGLETFFSTHDSSFKLEHPLEPFKENTLENRNIASQSETTDLQGLEDKESNNLYHASIFTQLEGLIAGLENNTPELIRDLLPELDQSLSRVITMRTRLGSIINSVENAQQNIESNEVDHAARKSQLIDADVGELFSDLNNQQYVLKTAYIAGKNTMNQRLIDFLK